MADEIVLAEEGYPVLLQALLAELDVYVHLYTNDPTLGPGLTPASFTEPVYGAYAPLSASRWSPVALRAGRAYAVLDPVVFLWSFAPTPDPIRGYYATDGPAGRLLWAWRRPGASFPLGPSNRSLVINLEVTFPLIC